MSDRLLAQLVLLGALPLTLASAAEVWGWPRCLGWLAELAKKTPPGQGERTHLSFGVARGEAQTRPDHLQLQTTLTPTQRA